MNALLGRAIADGRLSLESTMEELGIDDVAPALTADEKRATLRDCMMGRSGIYHRAAYEPLGAAAQRPARGSHPPGEYWFYNNWDFNVLATISKQAVGLDSFRAFDEWFARPMGMQDFDPSACSEFFEDASQHPAYLFSVSARDLARFGYLYLCRGSWAGSRLLSEDWIARSLQPHSPATHGYEVVGHAPRAAGGPAQLCDPRRVRARGLHHSRAAGGHRPSQRRRGDRSQLARHHSGARLDRRTLPRGGTLIRLESG